MGMFYLWISLGHGILIPQPYPSKQACEEAYKQSTLTYNSYVCIPAPIIKYSEPAPLDLSGIIIGPSLIMPSVGK